jgi:hypothetical protein
LFWFRIFFAKKTTTKANGINNSKTILDVFDFSIALLQLFGNFSEYKLIPT